MHGTAARLDLVDDMISDSARRGLGHLVAQDERLDGRTIRVGGRDLVNFASCSYLGLELDPRLRAGAIDAVDRFGTQFSSSRSFVSAPPYAELEEQLSKIFDGHAIATPSTTLGHLSAIPTLIDERDAVILDHQVHHSLQVATAQLKAIGAHVELLRHSRMDLLEERLLELQHRHRHVWYMADGVYSMHGDLAPFETLQKLLDRFESLHLYMDDAHGMSWYGRHGRGVALAHMPLHPRMVLATSLNKSFAAGGGALVFPDAETRRRVITCGGPLIFSGPIQPPMLGAALASARIHLSPEIGELQRRLGERTALFDRLLRERGLPLLSASSSPLFFVSVGLPRAAQAVSSQLLNEGFYVNVGQFPAVPMKGAGVRITLTLHHREEDIRALADALERHFPVRLGKERESEDVAPRRGRMSQPAHRPSSSRPAVSLECSDSIEDADPVEWNELLGGRGGFDFEGLRFLENSFSSDNLPENSWRFRYYRVRDRSGRVLLATFFSEALWKADMLAAAGVSRKVEGTRKQDPYFLTMRTLAMGTLLTDGDHLYLDRSSPLWKEALAELLSAICRDSDDSKADLVALRDLPADDSELEEFLCERGFVRTLGPDRWVSHTNWSSETEMVAGLSRNSRRHHRRAVRPWNDSYDVEVIDRRGRALSAPEIDRLRALYRNVKASSLELNTFDLPDDLFSRMAESSCWELLLLRVRDEPSSLPVGMVACFVGSDLYVPTVVGLDYRYVRQRGLYRQCLRHVLLRGRELGKSRVCLGMGAPLEKQRFGAQPHASALYLQPRDQYALDAVAQMNERDTA